MAYDVKCNSLADLLLDENLSHDEKDLIRASEEGMQNDDRPDILKEVKKALISLQESSSGR